MTIKPSPTSKACKICGQEKPIGDYYFANRAKEIFSSYCKTCQKKIGNAQRAVRPSGRVRDKCTRLKTTVTWFYGQLELQNHRCAICLEPESHPVFKGGKTRMLAIDHDHSNGILRGLLCFRCNTSIHLIDKFGYGWAERAVQYLKKYSTET